MSRKNLSQFDASVRAGSELEYVIKKSSSNVSTEKKISTEEAMTQARVFKKDTGRNVTRVLFISQDTSLLNPETQSLDGFLNLSELFDEVHILILRAGIPAKNPVLRVSDNVWLYTASARSWRKKTAAGLELIEQQLQFASGFRADLIIARDPFESAQIASALATKYQRPSQLHITEDFTAKKWKKTAPENFWRGFIPKRTIPQFQSIRVSTGNLEKYISSKYVVKDLSVLPRFNNYDSLLTVKPTLDLKEKYKPFVFFILYVGKLNHESTAYRAIDAARFVLRNPRVGMVVLGDGPARTEFQKRTKILGIENQVVFETKVNDIVPYLKSANMLITTDTDSDSDEIIMQAAACGIPVVMSRTEHREDLFEHGESAFLCEESDLQSFTDSVNTLLNEFGLRRRFVDEAQLMISRNFHQSAAEYREAYRLSLEQAMFIDFEEEVSE